MSGVISRVIEQVYSSVPTPNELRPKIATAKTPVKLLHNPAMPVVKAPVAETVANKSKKPATKCLHHYGWRLPHGY